VHDDCLALQSQWQTLSQQESQQQEALRRRKPVRCRTLRSPFADQQAFLAACSMKRRASGWSSLNRRWKMPTAK
jgi:hypothetical protein